jgi:hypothetical protein
MQTYEKTRKLSLAIPIVLLVLALALAGTAAKGIGVTFAILSVVMGFYRCSQNWVEYGEEHPGTQRAENIVEDWGEAEFLRGNPHFDDALLGNPNPMSLSATNITPMGDD